MDSKISFKELNEYLNEYNLVKEILKYSKYTPETHYQQLISKYGNLDNEELYKNEKLPDNFLIKYSEDIDWGYYFLYNNISEKIWKKCKEEIGWNEIGKCHSCKRITYVDSMCGYCHILNCENCSINYYERYCNCI